MEKKELTEQGKAVLLEWGEKLLYLTNACELVCCDETVEARKKAMEICDILTGAFGLRSHVYGKVFEVYDPDFDGDNNVVFCVKLAFVDITLFDE